MEGSHENRTYQALLAELERREAECARLSAQLRECELQSQGQTVDLRQARDRADVDEARHSRDTGRLRDARVHIERQDVELSERQGAIDRLERQATRREASLRESEARYEGLFDALRDPVLMADPERGIVDINPAFSAEFGYTLDELRGKSTSVLYTDPADYLKVGRAIEANQESRTPFVAEARFRRKSGEVFPAELTSYFVQDDSGRVVRFAAVLRDLTERLEKEKLQTERLEALEATDRMKDQFLSILSHELRTPINAIMGFASILDDELAGPMSDEQHRYMAKVLEGSERMLSLVSDLLDMTRIRAGKLSINPVTSDFGAIVTDVLAEFDPPASTKGVRLVNQVSTALPPVSADEVRVAQVLNNLVGNAIKFTPSGGVITVRACVDDSFLRCEVSDTGIGIAPDDRPKLFQRFSQVDMSNTRRAGGTGLGLSIVRALVEAHGGEVGVESLAGKGSTFWFTLRLADGLRRG